MSRAILITGFAPDAVKSAVATQLQAAMAARSSSTGTASPLAVETTEVYAGADEPKLLRTRFGAILAAVDDAEGASKLRNRYQYNLRAFYNPSATQGNQSGQPEEDVDAAAVEAAVAYLMEGLFNPPMTRFVSSRQASTDATTTSFLGAVRKGLASDGGLFLPTNLGAPFPRGVLEMLCATDGFQNYQRLAQVVLERLVDKAEVPPGLLQAQIERAYDPAAWHNSVNACPLADATSEAAKAAGVHVALCQQYCGPTSAFKDFALQLFPQWFDLATTVASEADGGGADEDATATTASSPHKYLILAATSGDTGGAAINGFVRGAPDIKVMVLYPTKGVSPVQRLQMLSMNGGNVHVVAVDDDFDFCQSTVKHIFNDASVAEKLAAESGTALSSANSINWGRLLPQIVYYFASYATLVREGKLAAFGERMDVCIPTGNFGNILACYVARRLGLPVGRLVLAANANDVLHEFVSTGVYDISRRTLDLTASPSIDILKASNVERFLHLASNGDGALVAQLMSDLSTKKAFTAPPAVAQELRSLFWSSKCDELTCRQTIRQTYESARVVIDPHTAVAMHVASQYIATDQPQRAKVLLVASTAHWAKFPEPVAEGLGLVDSAADGKGNAATADDIRALYRRVLERCPETSVSAPLAEIFAKDALTETGARMPASVEAIVQELLQFARRA